MQDVFIVGAARSPIGKRGKGLAGMMPADLLGAVQRGALDRAGVKPENVGQVIGCLLYTSPSPRDKRQSRMPSSA